MNRARVAPIRAALLDWYGSERRDLPWRRSRDPYRIWVSEIMLQQTRVSVVVPYYERFCRRFPTVRDLAAADEETVLAHWTGLGYYRRARDLRRGAIAVCERHDGRVPCDPRELLALPGVGRYTAGAIASIAFGAEEPILDGNVRRVLSRIFTVSGRPGGATDRTLWAWARRLVEGPRPGDLNQAMMELGSEICRPAGPGCDRCPVAADCAGRASGAPERWPELPPRRATERVTVAVAWIERAGRVLLERPGPENPLRGTWELPARCVDGPEALGEALARSHRLELSPAAAGGRVRHGILHRRLELCWFRFRARRGRTAGRPDLRWAAPADFGELPLSGATRKVAAGTVRYDVGESRSVP